MEVHLIRHTTPDVAEGICYGQTDLALRSTWGGEFDRVLSEVAPDYDVVYTSPKQRCLLLANKITAENAAQVDDRLMEINFGAWEMCPWDGIKSSDLNVWMNDFANQAPPGGESLKSLNERVLTFWMEVLAQGYQKVAIVTHNGVIRCLMAHFQRLDVSQCFEAELGLAYGGLAIYQRDATGAFVRLK
jgi:alpha-ribazole phosphatase